MRNIFLVRIVFFEKNILPLKLGRVADLKAERFFAGLNRAGHTFLKVHHAVSAIYVVDSWSF